MLAGSTARPPGATRGQQLMSPVRRISDIMSPCRVPALRTSGDREWAELHARLVGPVFAGPGLLQGWAVRAPQGLTMGTLALYLIQAFEARRSS